MLVIIATEFRSVLGCLYLLNAAMSTGIRRPEARSFLLRPRAASTKLAASKLASFPCGCVYTSVTSSVNESTARVRRCHRNQIAHIFTI